MSRPLIAREENTMAQATATQQRTKQASEKNAIRPFHVNVPEAELTQLRRRIDATKWPERKRLWMHPKEYTSRRFRPWRAIGRQRRFARASDPCGRNLLEEMRHA